MFQIAENTEEFKKFYEQFSKNLKLGIHEDANQQSKISRIIKILFILLRKSVTIHELSLIYFINKCVLSFF